MPEPTFRIFAHRGYSARYPENTLLAFRKALDAGATGVELDLQCLKSGEFIVLHDATLERTSNGHGPVQERSLTELRQLDFGQGERLPTLDEVLALVPPERWLNLELKGETFTAADAQRLLRHLQQSGRVPGRIHVSSFHHELLRVFARAGVETGMLLGEEHRALPPAELLRRVWSVRPACINLPIQAFERVGRWKLRVLLTGFRLLGSRLLFWTVNRQEDWERVRPWADGLITDEVEKARIWSGV